MEKIDIMNSDYQFEKAMNSLSEFSKKNQKLMKEFLEANALGKTSLKSSRNRQAGIRAQTKTIYLLKISARFFKKDLDSLTEKDIEKLVTALNKNELLKSNGKKYSEQTKSNIKKTLIMFLRFVIKDKDKFEKLTEWVSTSFKKKEIPALTEEEIRKLLKVCNTLKQKILISVLFDSGARIEEFLNIRMGDIVEVGGSLPYFKITIRTEFSKTKGRTFGLFWDETTEILKNWIEQHSKKDESDAVLYDSTYDGVRKLLDKLGKRALNKHINPHLFRHSSATYYAGKGMDYFQLCNRFGWSIGSNVPKEYIDRSGIKDKAFASKVETNRVEDLQEKIREVEQREKIKEEELKKLHSKIDFLLSKGYEKQMKKIYADFDRKLREVKTK